jgi:type I restriction enzyme S subunit
MLLRGLVMGLGKYKLGELIQIHDERNVELAYGLNDVKGISIQKEFIETKADMSGVSLKPYILVKPGCFAYVTVTSRNGEKITIAHNNTNNTYIISSSYIVFRVKRTDLLLPDYLFMYFKRSEFDRYARYNSWGSARETFSWEEMCDIDIELPDIAIQQKYVDIYNAMLENQRCYESALEDLKLVCDAYIEELSKDYQSVTIGQFIFQRDLRNDGSLGVSSVRGIATSKEFINTKADMEGVGLNNYKVVAPGQFAYVPDTSRRGDKISLALNISENTYLVSSISIVFDTQKDVLLPEYLMLFFVRSEFDRYARFHSWGSARETFDWSEMCDVQIPIPDIKIQQYIVNIYTAYLLRKEINEQLKTQVKDVCPILIKGSLEEAENG